MRSNTIVSSNFSRQIIIHLAIFAKNSKLLYLIFLSLWAPNTGSEQFTLFAWLNTIVGSNFYALFLLDLKKIHEKLPTVILKKDGSVSLFCVTKGTYFYNIFIKQGHLKQIYFMPINSIQISVCGNARCFAHIF